jgi:hypothetical protein
VEPLPRLCAALGIPWFLDKAGDGSAVLDFFGQAEAAALFIRGSAETADSIAPETLAELACRYAEALAPSIQAGGLGPNADYSYSVIGAGFFVSERTKVIIALLVCAGISLGLIARRRKRKR